VRLATGCSREDAQRLCQTLVSDTTARARRDEWITSGVFDAVVNEAISSSDKVMGSLRSRRRRVTAQTPAGGPGTGKNSTDRGKLGWKWSIMTDKFGIPIGWTIEGANRNDCILLKPTMANAAEPGPLGDIGTI
jgi:hypothetical protein